MRAALITVGVALSCLGLSACITVNTAPAPPESSPPLTLKERTRVVDDEPDVVPEPDETRAPESDSDDVAGDPTDGFRFAVAACNQVDNWGEAIKEEPPRFLPLGVTLVSLAAEEDPRFVTMLGNYQVVADALASGEEEDTGARAYAEILVQCESLKAESIERFGTDELNSTSREERQFIEQQVSELITPDSDILKDEGCLLYLMEPDTFLQFIFEGFLEAAEGEEVNDLPTLVVGLHSAISDRVNDVCFGDSEDDALTGSTV